VFLDFGYAQAEVFVEKNVYTMYNKISKKPIQSYKTMVQEHLQKLYKELPSYKDIEHEIDSK
jgi:dsRNA-specific ribonuclease